MAVTFPATSLQLCPTPAAVPLPVGTSARSALTRDQHRGPTLLPLQQNTPSKGTGVKVSVGLCFWGDQNPNSPFPEASKYPLKPINCVSTGWLLHTCSHTALGNKSAPHTGLQTHTFWFQKKINFSLK